MWNGTCWQQQETVQHHGSSPCCPSEMKINFDTTFSHRCHFLLYCSAGVLNPSSSWTRSKAICPSCFPEIIAACFTRSHCISEIRIDSSLNSSLYLFIAQTKLPNLARLFICIGVPKTDFPLTQFLAFKQVKHWFPLCHPRACSLSVLFSTVSLSSSFNHLFMFF